MCGGGEEAQEQRLPVTYALALACVVFMLVSVLIGDGARHNAHAYSVPSAFLNKLCQLIKTLKVQCHIHTHTHTHNPTIWY